MSDSDSAVSSAVVSADSGETPALVTLGATATPSDGAWSAWDLAGLDPQPSEGGIDQVNAAADAGDWFPSAPSVGVMTASLSGEPDVDPLVRLPPSEFAQVADGLDDGDAYVVATETTAPEHTVAWDALHHPIDHSLPFDHVDWHLGGLLS